MTQRDIDTAKSLATDFVDECLMELGVKAIAQALQDRGKEEREIGRKEGREEANKTIAEMVKVLKESKKHPCNMHWEFVNNALRIGGRNG
jgi:hypothetical protein